MEDTALSVGKSVLKEVVGYAKSTIAQEIALQLGVQRDQAFIRDELEMMLAFLMAAHEERDAHKVVKTWVKQVRDTAFDVEDSLLDFAVRLRKPSWWRILGMLRMLIERHHVAKQMKDLRAKVEDVSQRNERYRLIKDSTTASDALELSNACAAMFDMEEARQQEDKAEENLSVLISREDQNLQVISLLETGGVLGLTSLIKWAYDDLRKEKKFECYAWVRVMHPFDDSEFHKSILREFYKSDIEKAGKILEETSIGVGAEVLKRMKMMQDDELLDDFNRYVKDKQYLVILSGIATIEEWDLIMSYFPKSNTKGSRILVSTVHIEVARLCAGRQSEMFELKGSHTDTRFHGFCDPGLQGSKKAGMAESSYNSTNGEAPKVKESSCPNFELFGVKEKREEIINLISKEGGPQVVPVWGKGGIGKTVLVKDIYQSQKHFEKHAFVTIKHPFVAKDVINSLTVQLMEMISENKMNVVNKSFAGGMIDVKIPNENKKKGLPDLLRGKYLIVLDDLSSTAEWDAVRDYFTGAEGRILVTTRDQNIAKYCSSENQVNLADLPDEVARQLFMKKVFNNAETDLNKEHRELVGEAESILKWCGGLPLAIVTIGSYLAEKPRDRTEWRKLTNHIRAELDTNPELGKIKNVLSSCYDSLPYHLKYCFLYLSIFPEDHTISRRRLVRRWIAEGYSSEVHGKYVEELASRYFDKLTEKNMIKPSNTSLRSRKEIDSCQVHDLMREISILRSMEENLVLRLEKGGLNTRGRTRHLSVSSDWKGDQREFEYVTESSGSIRSLTVFGKWRPFFISEKMRYLRVLDLEDTSGLVQHHLEDIGKLFVLKYLSLRGCRGIMYLPDSFGNLRQLQTLDISGTSVMYLPKTIVKLTQLQYLRAWTKRVAEDIDFHIAEACAACCAPQIMKGLLESSESSSNYHRGDVCKFCCCLVFRPTLKSRLTLPGVVVPKGVRRLKSLLTLGGVNVERNKVVLQDIRRLTGLRKLSVTGINNKNCNQFCSALARLTNLESLLVRSDAVQSLKLFQTSSPPKSLQSLKLIGTLDELPDWVKKLSNLEKLKLKSTKLKSYQDTIKALGELAKLKILRLLEGSFQREGQELCLEFHATSFKNLKVLELDTLGNLTSVKFHTEAMPKLERLLYRDRGNRKNNPASSDSQEKEKTPSMSNSEAEMLPGSQEKTLASFSGLESLPSLKEFLLSNNDSYKKESIESLEEKLKGTNEESSKRVLKIC